MSWLLDITRKLDISRFPCVIAVGAVDSDDGPDSALAVTLYVKDRDTGLPRMITTVYQVPSVSLTKSAAIEWIRESIVKSLAHEVGECLMFDKIRFLDPHVHMLNDLGVLV